MKKRAAVLGTIAGALMMASAGAASAEILTYYPSDNGGDSGAAFKACVIARAVVQSQSGKDQPDCQLDAMGNWYFDAQR